MNVAIDDFGTGYSSMSYLHRLTVDTLKIDQVFVAGMCDNRLDLTIVELLLRLGDSLGMTVIAEGVDSEQKLTLLRELGLPVGAGLPHRPADERERCHPLAAAAGGTRHLAAVGRRRSLAA